MTSHVFMASCASARKNLRGGVTNLLALTLLAALCLPFVARAAEKVVTPVITKTIEVTSASGSPVGQSMADAAVGENATYRLEGTLPSNWDDFKFYRYEFHDQPDAGIEVDLSSVRVALVDEKGEQKRDLTSWFVVSDFSDDDSWSATIDDLKAEAPDALASDKVVLTYEAALEPAWAVSGTANARDNTAYLVYTSKPFTDALGQSKDSQASLVTWGLSLAKVDAEDTSRALAGAAFTLRAPDGRYVCADGTLSVSPQELSCDEKGLLQVVGLASGTYELAEMRAPEGYDLPGQSYHVTISADLTGEKSGLSVTIEESSETSELDAAEGMVSLVVPNAKTAVSVIPSISGTPKTGDAERTAFSVLVALAGAFLVAMAVLQRRQVQE